jgi:undecaprenyl phosphate N,N'-diacetylbacillosamine 1-phosphate transferase
MYKRIIKRLFDLLAALFGITVFLPFFICLLPVVSMSNGGKVFFNQKRPGKGGLLFSLLKLKTMNDRKDDSGKLLPDRVRLTPVGRFIRSLSIDELPQLWNVLRGDMSIVGPRPLLPKYLSLYNARQARRHEVRPGITGWAQVNGRNTLSWEEKFELDVWYVDNVSFTLDLKILFQTIVKVLRREGISSVNSATMEVFTGSPES